LSAKVQNGPGKSVGLAKEGDDLFERAGTVADLALHVQPEFCERPVAAVGYEYRVVPEPG